MNFRLVRFVPLLAFFSVVACGNSEKPATPTERSPGPQAVSGSNSPVVARVGDVVITAEHVEEKLAQQSPEMRSRYNDLNQRKTFVESLVRFEMLARAAYERGLDKEPRVAETIKKILVQELIRDAFDDKKAEYSEEQLRAYYEKHLSDYVKPERMRSSHIYIHAPAEDAGARAAAKQKTAGLLSQLKTNVARAAPAHRQHAQYVPNLFAKLAREFSDDQTTRMAGGDLRSLSHEDLERLWSTELADAVFALKGPNDLTGVVETTQGFHIAAFTSRAHAVNRRFEDAGVQDTLKGRLFREEGTKAFDEFVESLRARPDVSIDEKALAEISVQKPVVSPVGAPPSPVVPAERK